MPESPENPQQPAETITDFFRATVERLLHENPDEVVRTSLALRRVEVLHLIDEHPQASRLLDYHCVYRLFDVLSSKTSHGVYLANLWPRTRDTPIKESRHYFTAGEDLITRQDIRSKAAQNNYEFLSGPDLSNSDPSDESDSEVLAMFTDLHKDLARVHRSQSIKPFSLVFNQFAQLK